jgi:hypothetical protein
MSVEINCRNRLTPPDGRRRSGGNERKQKIVTISLQPSFPVLAMLGLKNQRKTMQIKNDVAESDALTIGKSASALGVHEFSLFSRIQAGDIIAARLWSGEIAIPISELERLSKLSIYSLAIPPDKPEAVLPDARLGIKRDPYSGLTDVPIKQNQLAVDRNHRAKLRRADPRLEVGEERGVTSGKRAGRFAILSAGFCETCGCRLSFRHTKSLPAVLPTTILN